MLVNVLATASIRSAVLQTFSAQFTCVHIGYCTSKSVIVLIKLGTTNFVVACGRNLRLVDRSLKRQITLMSFCFVFQAFCRKAHAAEGKGIACTVMFKLL